MVAYKGGHNEKERLQRWGIPHCNLEQAQCPKFDTMTRLCRPTPCGCHDHPWRNHCPQIECYHFVHWMRGQLGLDRDWNFVNRHRIHRWMACTSKPIKNSPWKKNFFKVWSLFWMGILFFHYLIILLLSFFLFSFFTFINFYFSIFLFSNFSIFIFLFFPFLYFNFSIFLFFHFFIFHFFPFFFFYFFIF